MEMKQKKNGLEIGSFYVCCFFAYALIGWLYEVFLEVVVYRWGFSDRGVLLGPYLPVYGLGAMIFVLVVYPLIKGKSVKRKIGFIPIVFLSCALLASGVELIASYLCEATMGSWPWQTYVDYDLNFQGRVALSPSIRFGLGGVLFLYGLQPLFEKFFLKLEGSMLKRIAAGIVILLILDVSYTLLR